MGGTSACIQEPREWLHCLPDFHGVAFPIRSLMPLERALGPGQSEHLSGRFSEMWTQSHHLRLTSLPDALAPPTPHPRCAITFSMLPGARPIFCSTELLSRS